MREYPTLATQRLVLDELKEEHLEDFYPFAYFEGKPVDSKGKALEIIQRTAELYNQGETINWGMFLDSKLIGTIGYYRGFKNNIGEVGYVMHEDYHGKGYMSESIQKVLAYGFEDLDLKMIEAFTELSNEPSVRLLMKHGFVRSDRSLDEYTIFELYPK
jgi:ribosomal-protein-alanine N-acetyltransferase